MRFYYSSRYAGRPAQSSNGSRCRAHSPSALPPKAQSTHTEVTWSFLEHHNTEQCTYTLLTNPIFLPGAQPLTAPTRQLHTCMPTPQTCCCTLARQLHTCMPISLTCCCTLIQQLHTCMPTPQTCCCTLTRQLQTCGVGVRTKQKHTAYHTGPQLHANTRQLPHNSCTLHAHKVLPTQQQVHICIATYELHAHSVISHSIVIADVKPNYHLQGAQLPTAPTRQLHLPTRCLRLCWQLKGGPGCQKGHLKSKVTGKDRVGCNCIYTSYMTVYSVISLPKIPYTAHIYIYIYIYIWPSLGVGQLFQSPHLRGKRCFRLKNAIRKAGLHTLTW